MPGGRPTKLTDKMYIDARAYIEQYAEWDHAIPSVVGMCGALGVARATLYKWAEDDDTFSDILREVNEKQEQLLISSGLKGEFNSNITKLVLGKHGYKDQVETDQNMNVSIDGKDANTF